MPVRGGERLRGAVAPQPRRLARSAGIFRVRGRNLPYISAPPGLQGRPFRRGLHIFRHVDIG
jgi:hypothetical protein